MDIRQYYASQLNTTQQEVVSPKTGVLLVTAGAGSGKTRVITARMAYLITEHKVLPTAIVALTFTNKAGKEMKDRITQFLPQNGTLPFVGTFHSFCLRLLKSNPHLLPISTFSLMDEQDQEKIARQLIADKGLTKRLQPRQLLSYISRIKNEATNDHEREALWGTDTLYKELFFLYEDKKTQAHCLDFDDLILQALFLFRKNEIFRKIFQEQTRHVLVDEYQDTNKVQHALLKVMTTDQEGFALDSLCVVGDEDQSIYSWRGATVSNIINFAKDFPGALSITVEQNYRSVQPILHIANEVIKNNLYRNPKKLFSGKEASDSIRLLVCASGYQEGEAIAHLLKRSRHSNKLNDHAILYRSHFQSRTIEEALIRHSIPYKIMGGIQFYDRLEIKDLLAYMRLLVNPFDRLAFGRIINKPARGLGDKFEEQFQELWDLMPFESYSVIARSLIEHKKVTGIKAEALIAFLDVFQGLTASSKPSTVLAILIKKTDYYTYLDTAFDKEEALAKKENVKELMNGILFFEERTQGTVDTFLQDVSLLQEQMNEQENSDSVKLMTFHAAKGLEFDTVILAGIEEGILPSTHALYSPERMEEERRLLYVGITRARERLFITRSKFRYTYGQLSDQYPSRFLSEIPEDHAPQEDASFWKDFEFKSYFESWFSPTAAGKKYQPSAILDYTYEPAFSDEAGSESHAPSLWKRYQSVLHSTFGQGVIEKIEQKSSGTHLTIRFKSGIKTRRILYFATVISHAHQT